MLLVDAALDAELVRVSGPVVRPEEHVEVGGKVCEVVPRLPRVMPVMELRRAEHIREGPERKAHVGVDEDGPEGSKDGDSREHVDAHAEEHRREVHQQRRRDPVERMLTVCGHPV